MSLFKPFEGDCICKNQVNQLAGKEVLLKWDFPDDPCVKCMIKCYSLKIGTLDYDGNVYPQIAANKLLGLSLKQAQFCADKGKDIVDNCKKMYAIAYCTSIIVAAGYNISLPLPQILSTGNPHFFNL